MPPIIAIFAIYAGSVKLASARPWDQTETEKSTSTRNIDIRINPLSSLELNLLREVAAAAGLPLN
ncbi:hypothetical protein AB833_14610 [Chromatiales bacterium (ex Bugula neritina AB1)]|nr:hypothetical protein AB833_14610 [Chromatiales bacterium (ex Bugula neritina AB1)]